MQWDALRLVAPWICGVQTQLRQALSEAAPADAQALNAVLMPMLGEARRRASVARWGQGPAAWRHWADRVRSLHIQFDGDVRAGQLLDWLASADFSDQVFTGVADFDGFDIPAAASFERAQFLRDAWFSGARFTGPARFRGARFCEDALFEQCCFKAEADFGDSTFVGSVRLSASVFVGGMLAQRGQFGADLWMRSSQFFGPLDFSKARITGEAGLGSCCFQATSFAEVEFCDNAGFEDSIFAGAASFEHASFAANARFERARFAVQPKFKATRFYRTCRFDDAMIPVLVSPIVTCREEIERRFGR